MALTSCRECNKQISSSAKSCPQCGAPVKRTSCLVVVLICLLVGLGLFALIGVFIEDPTSAGHSNGVIYKVTTRLVADRLASPSTAEFPSFYDAGAATFTPLGNDRFAITSYVDSQNAYGAQVRSHWTATVSVSGKTVRLENLVTK